MIGVGLARLSFTGPFLNLIRAMYSTPSVQVVAAGHISPPIRLFKGTMQGCLLSPLLFNLAIEPLSRSLTHHARLKGIRVGTQELHTTLFAEDVVIFISDPHNDLPIIQSIFKNFRSCSGLHINFSKSEILPLNTTRRTP